MAASVAAVRDTRWLTLEVCREFQRGTCLRADSECKFAHPAQSCQVETGRVIACFDSLKGRCSRENCKYLHPPPRLRSQLEESGRDTLMQQRKLAVLAHLAQALGPWGPPLQTVPMYSLVPSLGPGLGAGVGVAAFSPYLAHADQMSPTPVLLTSTTPPAPPAPPATTAHKLLRTDRLEVCREFQRGNCTRGESDCRFAHPADSTMIDTNDNTVTVCMDYIKDRCSREVCKYVHPPAHLQAKIRATQHQVSLAAAAAMGLPPVMPPLPKRPMLEKAAGAADMFHTGVFQYQPGLASMPFQQQAFIPSVPMMHGAAASLLAPDSAVSGVPFASSMANQIPIISADHLTSHKYVTQV